MGAGNPNITRVQTDNEEVNRLQDAVRRGTEDVSAIGRGNCIVDVVFAAGGETIEVPHLLGQRFQGATCVKCNTPGADFVIEDSDVDSTQFVKITTSNPAELTASFWVF